MTNVTENLRSSSRRFLREGPAFAAALSELAQGGAPAGWHRLMYSFLSYIKLGPSFPSFRHKARKTRGCRARNPSFFRHSSVIASALARGHAPVRTSRRAAMRRIFHETRPMKG